MGESEESSGVAKGSYHIEKPITVWGLEKIINKIRADLNKA
jgi:hypothetical protein